MLVDILSLEKLQENSVPVHLSFWDQRAGKIVRLPFQVNPNSRVVFLRLGPLFFMESFKDMQLSGESCLVGENQNDAIDLVLDSLFEKLIGSNDIEEAVHEIHALTEVDMDQFESADDLTDFYSNNGFCR